MEQEEYTILVGKTPKDAGYPRGCPVEIEVKIELDRETVAPHLDVDLKPCPTINQLSICGSVWQVNRRDTYSGGQNLEEIATLFPHNKRVRRLVEIWRRWHLNGMKAGTRKQTACLNAYKAACPDWRYDYSEAQDILSENGLREVGMWRGSSGNQKPHPYSYGHAWLAEPLPDDILAEIRELCREDAGS